MRKLLTSTLLIGAVAFATPALAKSRGFETTISSPLTTAVKVEVVIGEELAYRAENLPKKLRDRGTSSRGLNSGFSQNGFYGTKDINRLAERLQKKVERRFAKKGIEVNENAPTTLRLVITDAKPNRPTFEQLSRQPQLQFSSFGLGGAEIEGELLQAGGQSMGTLSYSFYENDIRFNGSGRAIWADAYRAFDRLSRRVAKKLLKS